MTLSFAIGAMIKIAETPHSPGHRDWSSPDRGDRYRYRGAILGGLGLGLPLAFATANMRSGGGALTLLGTGLGMVGGMAAGHLAHKVTE